MKNEEERLFAASQKVSELSAKLKSAVDDEDVTVEAAEKMKQDLKLAKQEEAEAEAAVKAAEEMAKAAHDKKEEGEPIVDPKEKAVENIKAFLKAGRNGHFKAAESGFVTSDGKPIIPEDIVYEPKDAIETVQDLVTLLDRTAVPAASGTWPVLERNKAILHTVEELSVNPELAKPAFHNVYYQVDTKRGALAVSKEVLQDSPYALQALQKSINDIRVNTYNDAIVKVLAGKAKGNNGANAGTFATETFTVDKMLDQLKNLLNVELDPAYTPVIIANQNFYQLLDTLKDRNGLYLLRQDITSKSGETVLGIPVVRVSNEVFSAAGIDNTKAAAFVGDVKRGVFFADRLNATIQWEYDQIFGDYLALALRFDVVCADPKAGKFVTVDSTPAPKDAAKK